MYEVPGCVKGYAWASFGLVACMTSRSQAKVTHVCTHGDLDVPKRSGYHSSYPPNPISRDPGIALGGPGFGKGVLC